MNIKKLSLAIFLAGLLVTVGATAQGIIEGRPGF